MGNGKFEAENFTCIAESLFMFVDICPNLKIHFTLYAGLEWMSTITGTWKNDAAENFAPQLDSCLHVQITHLAICNHCLIN